MTTEEQRELDAWIHKHIFEGDLYVGLKKHGYWYRPNARGYTADQKDAGRFTRDEAKKHEYLNDDPVTIHEFTPERYTTDPVAAMELLKKCLDKIGSDEAIRLGFENGIFKIGKIGFDSTRVYVETIEEAICLFARKLFSK